MPKQALQRLGNVDVSSESRTRKKSPGLGLHGAVEVHVLTLVGLALVAEGEGHRTQTPHFVLPAFYQLGKGEGTAKGRG
jgi:hypothetical protein